MLLFLVLTYHVNQKLLVFHCISKCWSVAGRMDCENGRIVLSDPSSRWMMSGYIMFILILAHRQARWQRTSSHGCTLSVARRKLPPITRFAIQVCLVFSRCRQCSNRATISILLLYTSDVFYIIHGCFNFAVMYFRCVYYSLCFISSCYQCSNRAAMSILLLCTSDVFCINHGCFILLLCTSGVFILFTYVLSSRVVVSVLIEHPWFFLHAHFSFI